MDIVIRIAAVWAVMGIVFGAAILWDKLREKHRNPARVFAVVDERTYKIAEQHIERLEELGDLARVQARLLSMKAWLKGEIRNGSRRKALDRARRLEQIELQLEQLHIRMFGHPSGVEAA